MVFDLSASAKKVEGHTTWVDIIRKQPNRDWLHYPTDLTDEEWAVIASHLRFSDYLAQYRLANIFLHALPYNAGATASDSL